MKREDAIVQALESFEDDLSADVFISKYAMKDGNDDYSETSLLDMKKRLANEMVRIEQKYNKPKWYSKKKNPTFENYMFLLDYFLFGGRTLYALGNKHESKASFSNCYVVPILDDSVEGIMACGTEMSQTYRGGGGCGTDVSILRPNGMRVENGAKTTSGAVSFIDLFSKITGVIGQNGRRGALMITIDVNHPDIIDFIKLKGGEDLEVAKNCNMSIKVTNKFMDLVANELFDAEWETSFTTHKGETLKKVFTVGEIWKLFIHSTWKRAEPSLIFWDTMLNDDPSSLIPEFKAHTTNPCITDDMWIDTSDGSQQVKNLISKQFKAVVNGVSYQSTIDGFFKTGDKNVLKLIFDNGVELKCTPDHKILVKDGKCEKWVEASNITKDMEVVLNDNTNTNRWDKSNSYNENIGYMIGLLLGDGTFDEDGAILSLYENEVLLIDNKNVCAISDILKKVESIVKFLPHRSDFIGWVKNKNNYTLQLKSFSNICSELGISKNEGKTITDKVQETSFDFYCGVIRGIFDTDGCVEGKDKNRNCISITQVKLDLLKRLQQMLLRIGIKSKIYENVRLPHDKMLPDGFGGLKLYQCKAQHKLVITGYYNLKTFYELINFLDISKKNKLQIILNDYDKKYKSNKFITKLKEIEQIGIYPVYDCTINDIHRFSANGVIVHNCGEIPLEPYGACNLGSIVLSNLVINPFIKPQFDYETFKKVIKLSVRALDLIIDENLKRQPLEQQKLTMKLGRRIGLGFTGYADMLSMMNLTYGSDLAIEFTDSMLLFFQREVLQASIELAIEKGAFDKWYKLTNQTKEDYINHSYFSVLSPQWKGLMKSHGVRNVGFTTVAPNGSLSIILGNVSSGIEPIFKRGYTRKAKIEGIEQTFTVYHKLVEKWNHIFEKYTDYRNKCILKYYLNGQGSICESVNAWLNETYGNNIEDISESLYQNTTKSDADKFMKDVQTYMLKTLFPESDEINWLQRVKTQGIIQKHISHSISSTINLASNIDEETVSKIYVEAYRYKLKGVTIYRDGSRGNILSKIDDIPPIKIQPLKTVKMNSAYNSKSLVIKSYENVDVDKIDDENYTKKWYVNLWIDEESKLPVAIFVNTNSKNKEKTIMVNQTIESLNKLAEKYIPHNIIEDNNFKIKNESNIDKLARVISMLLRHFTPIPEILNEIEKLNPPLGSFIFHIKHALAEFVDNQMTYESCPDCGEPMFYEGGCKICRNCGYSKCG
jgi:ribonucleoside-diphosphate reductase alpha chain